MTTNEESMISFIIFIITVLVIIIECYWLNIL